MGLYLDFFNFDVNIPSLPNILTLCINIDNGKFLAHLTAIFNEELAPLMHSARVSDSVVIVVHHRTRLDAFDPATWLANSICLVH